MNCVHSESRFNERSQEVIENKGHHFITNCNSQEVFENKWVILCKAKRLLISKALSCVGDSPDARAGQLVRRESRFQVGGEMSDGRRSQILSVVRTAMRRGPASAPWLGRASLLSDAEA